MCDSVCYLLSKMATTPKERSRENSKRSYHEDETLMPTDPELRPHFSSRLTIVVTCLGSVVGTGNIWRFPRVVANNSKDEGGLVFLIVWALFLMLWSIPMLIVEYSTGRYTQRGVIHSFRKLMSEKFAWCGAWLVMVNFFIAAYYSVVLGWCFYYFIYSCTHSLPDSQEESRRIFREFAEDSYWPVLTHAVAIILAGLSIVKGVKTIEKVSLVLVPIFLTLILFTFVWALTRSHANNGIEFLFTPNWESFGDPRVWVDALSQNAFDTGAGMGIMIIYSSYMTRVNGSVRYATVLPTLNNMVSLIAGMTVISTVFSTLIAWRPAMTQDQIVEILQDSGPGSTGLTFIWIPVLFQTVGVFGRVLAILFFLCLSFAGLTSLISSVELAAVTLDDFGLKRKCSMPITVLAMYLVGLMSALNINILTNQDFVWGFALVISGLMLQAMVIFYGVSNFRTIVVNDYGLGDWKLPTIWEYIIKFLAPVEAVLLIVWWAVDLISDETGPGVDQWYEFGRETFMVTIVQWLAVLLVAILFNVVTVCIARPKGDGEGALQLSYASYSADEFQNTGSTIGTARKSLEIRM